MSAPGGRPKTALKDFKKFIKMGSAVSLESLASSRGVEGYQECEILENGADEGTESGCRWQTCNKNPGHKKFLSLQQFSLKDLPSRTSGECYRRLKSLADLVVRIRVQWTSMDRPGYDDLAHLRGSRSLRLGSGVISYVAVSKDGEYCPCMECKGHVMRKHWKFMVHTACHVVYDTEEARRAKVDFFCDDLGCMKKGGRMRTVHALRLEYAASDTDKCIMLCVTHVETLAEKVLAVDQSWRSFCLYQPIINQKVRDTALRILREIAGGNSPVFVVIISHPHGQPKKVTIGQVISGAEDSSFNYNTATCPGSSGAPLFLVDSEILSPGFFPWFGYVHSGTFPNPQSVKRKKHINFSNNFVF